MSDTFDLTVNPDNLTIGDLEDFEDGVGKSLQEAVKPVPSRDENGDKVFDKDGRPEMEVQLSAKALRYLVFIVKRHSDPNFTAEDAKRVKVGQLVLTDATPDAEGNGESKTGDSADTSV